jgi:flavin-dependent dehydrogenase
MTRQVFVVARDQVDLYDYLREEFAAANVEIILDRRQDTDRRSARHRVVGPGNTDARDRRSADRRTRAVVDAQLGSLGYAMLYVD